MFGNIVHVYFVSLCIFIPYAHSACSTDDNGHRRYGPNCSYMCHCKTETEQCDGVTGYCSSGCADYWMGPGCQYRDLAKSGFWKHIDNVANYWADYASDGNLETCSRTAEPWSADANARKNPPWWRVWLDKKELITGLIIITEPSKASFFNGFSVYVEEVNVKFDWNVERPEYYTYSRRRTCYTHDGVTPLSTTIHVTCDVPLLDNHVRIELKEKQSQLVLCDVRIYGGRNLAYGRQAGQNPDYIMYPASSAVNGVVGTSHQTCSFTQNGANPWWSVDLNEIYDVYAVRMYTFGDGNIRYYKLESTIEATSAWKTLHDDDGQYTPTLYLNVSTVSARLLRVSRPRISGNLQLCEFQVFGDCPNNTCGLDCTQLCHCNTFPTYDKIYGVCSSGCEGRWTGSGGKCDIECSNDQWGPTCNYNCGHCRNSDPCNPQTGRCANGCADGYKHTNTCVTPCDTGRYGPLCANTCRGHCNNGAVCDRYNGQCPDGCAPGWQGEMCDFECDNGTFGVNCISDCNVNCEDSMACDKANGMCKSCKAGWSGATCEQACVDGQWGKDCLKPCGHCSGGQCDKSNGTCYRGCDPGYQLTPECDLACEQGFHGVNCKEICGNCSGGVSECDNTNGVCRLGCISGFGGDTCLTALDLSKQTSSPAAAIGGGVAAVVVISAIVLVLVFIIRRRSLNRPKSPFSNELETEEPRPNISSSPKGKNTSRQTGMKGNSREHVYISTELLQSSFDVITSVETSIQLPIKAKNKPPSKAKPSVKAATVYDPSDYYNSPLQRDLPDHAVWLSKLREYIRRQTSGTDFLTEEFNTFSSEMIYPTTVASKPENKGKNRYKEMYAYDHSRVILRILPGQPNSDYINANFINGYSMEKAYIAAQGTTKNNIVDFWRMIWEMKVSKIVMLTNLVENGKMKCIQYWKDAEEAVYGSIKINVASEEVFEEYTIRSFIVKLASQQRTITQYHFTAWPDKSTPKGTSGLVQFWSKVRKDNLESSYPWLVHCSAGVGRTGTFIALDILYNQGKELNYINVFECLKNLREQRVNMIQTKDQYKHLHELLFEALVLPCQAIPSRDFENKYRNLLHVDKKTGKANLIIEYEQIQDGRMCLWKDSSSDATETEGGTKDEFSVAKASENRSKNRYNNILASNEYRPFLSSRVVGCSDYINAVYFPSFSSKNGYILTQAPLEHTAVDCCRLVSENEIQLIVTIDDCGRENTGVYLPDKGKTTIGPFQIELISEEDKRSFRIRNYRMEFNEKVQFVKQLLFTKWAHDETVPRDYESMLTLIDEVEERKRQANNIPVMIQCLNGAERSGLLVVLLNVLERMRIEQEVAIPQVIRHMRQRRQQIIPNLEQYKFCHEIVLRHLQNSNTYANL